MKRFFNFSSIRITLAGFTAGLVMTFSAFAQDLPTAKSIAAEMGFAWNIGNSMEVPDDPLAWGNPLPTQQLIDSVKAAGFNTIRIPCAWASHADSTTYVINTAWMNQVKAVVDYCVNDSLFVVLNIHWDGGWLENKIDSSVTDTAMRGKIQARQGAYWRQIATAFRNYDRHVLFAGTNEPNVKDAVSMEVLNSFLQTFIDTVRATGGNNASRTLIIQGPNTDIENTNKLMTTLPTDKIADRLMAEVHFYPYQFCLMETDADWGKVFYYWGKNNHSTTDTDRNSTWCEEAFVDSMFNLMKTQFVDRNIPVLLGEFGAVKRLTLTGDTLTMHIQSRRTFYNYVLSSARDRGIIPVVWDAGNKGNLTMTVFDRKTGAIYDLGLLNAIRSGWGLSKFSGDTSLVQVATGNNAMKVLYSAKDSAWGQVNLGVVKTNMTTYDSIIVRAFVNGETSYDSAGTARYGFASLSLVTMSSNWTWREASFGTLTMNGWANYSIPISTDTTNKNALVPADPTKIDFFALQAYSKGYRGTIYVDWIIFKSKAGVNDTVYTFNLTAPEEGKGNVETVSLIATSAVETDQEWKTATSKYPSIAVIRRVSTSSKTFRVSTVNGNIQVAYMVPIAGIVNATVKDLQGKTIVSRSFNVKTGLNAFEIPTSYHGMMILQIQHGDQKFSSKIICH